MVSIIKYIVDMSPYMLISIPIIICFRLCYYLRNRIKINWKREMVFYIFVVFVVGLASQTLIPKLQIAEDLKFNIDLSRVNILPFRVIVDTYREVVIYGNIDYFIINFLGNIIMFIPIGLFIPALWNLSYKRVVLIGFLSSLFIELTQLFISRETDVDDLLLNTLGVYIGVTVFKLLDSKLNMLNKSRIK